MKQPEINLTRFFAWARARAFAELAARLNTNPQLDPNWTFSDIMQDLLTEYQKLSPGPSAEVTNEQPTTLS